MLADKGRKEWAKGNLFQGIIAQMMGVSDNGK
jgi:hypothetical protein